MTDTAVIQPTVWTEISLCAPPELVEALANFLIDEEANGVVIEDLATDDPFADRRRMGWLWIRAYFPAELVDALRGRLEVYLDELAALFPCSEPPLLDQRVPEVQDWHQCWKRFFKPMALSPRITVRPSWEDVSPAPGVQVMTLDPGVAFGTGKHPTTRLCLGALEEEVLFHAEGTRKSDIFSLLDVGTGSGILSIAAALLGLPRVLGIDNDPQAVDAAIANVATNKLSQRVEISDEPLDELIEQFDVIVANIVADTLVDQREELYKHLKPGGKLILSGVLRNQGAGVKDAFLSLPLVFANAHHDDEWCALVFEKI